MFSSNMENDGINGKLLRYGSFLLADALIKTTLSTCIYNVWKSLTKVAQLSCEFEMPVSTWNHNQ